MLNDDQKEVVREHLRKVLASSEFARSGRATAFLRFIVLHVLDETEEQLKERIIGIAVFDRPADWDPKFDTTVRSEARRVRKKLADYYASPAGEGQPVRIEVPLGTYIPNFDFPENNRPLQLTPPFAHISEATEGSKSWQVAPSPAGSLDLQTGHAQTIRSKILIGSILVTAFLALSLFLLSGRARTSAQSQSFKAVPFTSDYGQALGPSISPDMSQIAYVWDNGIAEYHIYLKAVQGGATRRLTGETSAELDPAWSPTGEQIAFLRVEDAGTDVVVRNIGDGAEHQIGAIATQIGDWTGDPGPLIGNLGPAWTPDGQNLIVSDHAPHANTTGLFCIRVSDGTRKQLTFTQASTQDFLPKVSPDGRRLAFVRAISHGITDIYLLDLGTGRSEQLTKEAHSINGLSWSKGSDRLIFSSNREGAFQLWTIDISSRTIHKLNTDSSTAIDPQLAADAAWLAYVSTSQTWDVNRIGLEQMPALRSERFIASSGRNHSARYSPDGKHVAFVSDRSGTWEVWLCQIACSEPQKLTDFRGPWIGGLSWSPDSQQLAFDARPGRNSAIYRLSITHPQAELIEKNGFEERMPSWSLDGKSLYFNSDRDGSVSIWRRTIDSGAMRKVTGGFFAREINSNGTLLVGQSDGTLWKVTGDTLVRSKLPNDVVANPVLAWTTLGEKVYYCTEDSHVGIRVVEYSNLHSRTLANLAIHSPRTSASIDISPDGHSLLITAVDHASSNIYRRIGVIPD